MSYKDNALAKARKLMSLGRLDEAESFFLNLATDPTLRELGLLGFAQVAFARNDFEMLLQRLDDFLNTYPKNLTARLIRAHILGLRGSIYTYRDSVKNILSEVEGGALLDDSAGWRLLISVQYALTLTERSNALQTLADSVSKTPQHSGANHLNALLFQAKLMLAMRNYEAYAQSVEKLRLASPQDTRVQALVKILNRLDDQSRSEGTVARKIFGIGLSRTGTTSFASALRQMGFDSAHWYNPHTRDLLDTEDFFMFDAFSDISVSYRFEQLYDSFPRAQFVYTTRNLDAWVRSISHHYQYTRRVESPTELGDPHQIGRYGGRLSVIENNVYSAHSSWRDSYGAFDDRVRSFFSGKRRARFLELDVTDTKGDGWGKLGTFLEQSTPKKPFPWSNRARKTDGNR